MSTTYSGKVKYECWEDHGYEPCPGHELEIHQHNTSDTVTILVDGKSWFCINQGGWNALRIAISQLDERNR